MNAKQSRIGALIVDPVGKPVMRPHGSVIMDRDAAVIECRARNEALRGRVPDVVGDYYRLVPVEVIG